ncbi:sugar-transfer associated ATP-grasp domain-containing protein [Gelidibacter maritimus]|uniref:Hexapeptide transferase n=1 Tax=Gelidibacter maritimus TaxID=2761487 RepID=A0A7W2M625_9FLAO|nr:sugar-transfer associated ATP-grasp domain-containing protein [Gelidibacter maritimus]MBA6153390.1 hexapeptide transferase [Gelidibacter maritimus]
MNRTLYLGYYFKQMKWDLLKKFLTHTSQLTGRSKTQLLLASIRDVYKYNISILEYFQFGFYNKTAEEKQFWAGTGTVYEFQKLANPPKQRVILDDKRLFYSNYKEFFKHQMYTLEELESDKGLVDRIYASNARIVLKESSGKAGGGIKILETSEIEASNLLSFMKQNRFGVLETYVKQHAKIQELSPSAVNTVRIFTQIRNDGTYEILGCRMRISVDSPVDNMAAGNLAAPVDVNTGVITGPGVYSDITKLPQEKHPITGIDILGFQIPYWEEILEMTEKAALKHPQNKSIGWDIVVTDDGPGFIEGNHDWCKLVWQLPVNKGLKPMLENYKNL